MLTADHWIETLGLEEHTEGGYFRRTFQADHRPRVPTPAGDRYTLTSIHYLLTRRSPIGHWHLNRSDILHFHHHGEPITYHLLFPDGRHRTAVLGQDPGQGQLLTLAVAGGVWKASHLTDGDHGLISEAVAPGFDYADMTLARAQDLLQTFPQHEELIHAYCRPRIGVTRNTTLR
ncbi:cupin domain-containing protein [Streptomyces sp. NBC_01185]|uniref:cupin domain-containing protein n=1 Tax=Streptomyces sp. NBC_01185 TaxID=2903764 RepID=UPI00386E725E|nr:cupin domain-containing protein [Streptomyces sp. NBC_01185]